MPQTPLPKQRPERLTSWKEIAAHFGKDARTVQYWERKRGLPIHRITGAKNTVFAYPHELEEWWKKRLCARIRRNCQLAESLAFCVSGMDGIKIPALSSRSEAATG